MFKTIKNANYGQDFILWLLLTIVRQSAACLWTAAIMKRVFCTFLGFVSILYYRECNKKKERIQGGQKQSHELRQKDPVTDS